MAKIVRLIPETEIDHGVGTGDFWVKVIDYDGTVLLEKRGNNGDSFDLPAAPSHEGLVFQEWSASQAITDNKITIADNNVMVGAVYTTASGQNEFDITLTKVTGLSVTLNMDGTKDWGDGTSDTETTHTYTTYGDYTIKCDGTTMTTSEDSGLFGQSTNTLNYYCVTARLANITEIGAYAFGFSWSLATVTLSNKITDIGSHTFSFCRILTHIIIPNSVTTGSLYAFQGCDRLTSVSLGMGISRIGTNAFWQCRALTNIAISKNITEIQTYAFMECIALSEIVIHNNVKSLYGSAFGDCKSLTSVTIPCNVIGPSVFSSCSNLTNVTFSGSPSEIGYSAFSGCSVLESVIIPNSVTKLGYSVFDNCYSLMNYNFSQFTSIPSLGNNAFYRINAIAKIIVPDSLYDEWIAAANWSTYADYIYKASEVTA